MRQGEKQNKSKQEQREEKSESNFLFPLSLSLSLSLFLSIAAANWCSQWLDSRKKEKERTSDQVDCNFSHSFWRRQRDKVPFYSSGTNDTNTRAGYKFTSEMNLNLWICSAVYLG